MRSSCYGAMFCLLLIAGLTFLGPLSKAVGAEVNPSSDLPLAEKATSSLLPPEPELLSEKVVVEVSSDAASPAETADPTAPVALVADSMAYNSEDDSYDAHGDVVLNQADVELKAQHLLWQAATQDAAATGSVQLSDAATVAWGDSLQYNLATGQGQIDNGRVLVHEGNFHLSGEQIEKLSQSQYRVENGSFTTCDGDVPDWKFSAREVDVTLGAYAQAKDVWFHIKDIPLLYVPYLVFPVKTERESGLLAPWFGYSSNKGVRTSLAWYQVIDRNMDATVYLDYLSEIGLGKGLEYRYALGLENTGKALYYHVDGISEYPDTYYLDWEHRGRLPGGWKIAADVEYTEDQFFFEEFGEIAEDYNRDKTVSTLMLQRNWEKLNLVGFARYIKDLEARNDETLQRLPEASLSLSRHRLGDSPVYASLESYATRFKRDQGEEGERLYLRPSLAAALKPGSWLEIVPEVALYERVYHADSGGEDKAIPEFTLTMATRLSRSFDLELWGMQRIQHSVEPQVSYLYRPDEDQEALPSFDPKDRLQRQNGVEYALVNRLVGRYDNGDGTASYREFLNLRLSQHYDIDEARNNRSGDDQPFSDLRMEVGFQPSKYFSFKADSLIPVYGDSEFRRLTLNATLHDERGNAVGVDYNYRDEDFDVTANDYMQLRLETALLDPLFLRVENRYDFRDNRELEKVVGLEYRARCWSLLLTYRERYRENDSDDQEVMVNFVLAGLGGNKGFGNGFGTVQH